MKLSLILFSILFLSIFTKDYSYGSFSKFAESIGIESKINNNLDKQSKVMPPSEDILDNESKVFNANYNDLYSFLHIDEITNENMKIRKPSQSKFLKNPIKLNVEQKKNMVSFKEKDLEKDQIESEIDFIKNSLV